jgi:hypothetical protein
MIKNTIYFLVVALIFSACKLEPEEFEASKGSADFSKTIFIGNSLTAGYSNGELYRSGQMESFPAIIAQSLKEVGFISSFKQPLMPDEVGFGKRMKLDYSNDCLGETSMGPVSYGELPDAVSYANIKDDGPFQNLGVPKIVVGHLLDPTLATSNDYFGRFASSTNATILNEALAQDPTFVVMWIGNNDVLGFATTGGDNPYAPITDAGQFENYFESVVNSLSAVGAKGVLCNIPDVTSTAFFTTVPYNAIPITDQPTADYINSNFTDYNTYAALVDGVEPISFEVGANAMIIEDKNPLYDNFRNRRQIKSNELVLLTIPQDSIKCAGWGTSTPVPEEYVLDEQELSEIAAATISFNNSIATVAETYGWGVVDINDMLDDIANNGWRIEGKDYTNDFITGGLFSLDGIHLTGNGNAIVANQIIETINSTFGASIPKTMVSQYSGVELP